MKFVIRTVLISALVVALLLGAVGSVRWAKRGGSAAKMMASALIFTLGMGVVSQPPQQGVEQAEEERDKANGESDDPVDKKTKGA